MLNFKVIVVPTDFSDRSLRALPYAVSLADRFDARLKILYVNEPSLQVSDVAWVGVDDRTTSEAHMEKARRTLEKIVLDHVPRDVRVDAEVISGDPVDAVVEYARDSGADLIVMATHGRGGLSHVLMGSVAEHIVRKAPCPVLTLKQPMPVTAETD
jgi:nucleotide-binding universal stress UspA family protein